MKYGGDYAGAYLLRRGLFMPWELEAYSGKEMSALGYAPAQPDLRHIGKVLSRRPATSFGKVAVLESSLYMRNQLLRDTDWASMAHSLEVRVPLVDVELLRRVSAAACKSKRRVSKRLLANSPRLPLPTKIMERAKTGFVTPIETWLQRDSRVQSWRQIPIFAVDNCPWARRWAFVEVAAA